MTNITTEAADGGFVLAIDGAPRLFLRGAEGSLTAEPLRDMTDDEKQKCFDACFAASGQTTADAKACAKRCGLE